MPRQARKLLGTAAIPLFWNGFTATLCGQMTQEDVVTTTAHSGIAASSQHSLIAKPLLAMDAYVYKSKQAEEHASASW